MAVEYWSQKDLDEFLEHPEEFYNRARALRAKAICEFFQKLVRNIASLFK